MADPNAMGNDNIPLCNNMTELVLLKDQTTSQRNHALVAVVVLLILCYVQNKRFNIIQRVNT